MNPQIIKIAIAATAGAAVGSVATYFAARRKIAREQAVIFGEQMEDILEEAQINLEKKYKVGRWAMPHGLETISGDIVVDKDLLEPAKPDVLSQVNAADLARLKQQLENHQYVADEDAPDSGNIFDNYKNEDEEEEEGETEEGPLDPNPYVISEDEFNNDRPEYHKIGLSYYPGDMVVCDDQERVVDDVESTVGRDNVTLWPTESTTLFIRNNRLSADFCISLETGKYSESVLGIESEAMERRGRRRHSEE